jgi:hypothetical protein
MYYDNREQIIYTDFTRLGTPPDRARVLPKPLPPLGLVGRWSCSLPKILAMSQLEMYSEPHSGPRNPERY